MKRDEYILKKKLEKLKQMKRVLKFIQKFELGNANIVDRTSVDIIDKRVNNDKKKTK